MLKKGRAIRELVEGLQNEIQLSDSQAKWVMTKMLEKISEMLIFCYASDPPFTIDPNTIGTDVEFNGKD